jgi:hypothetical protein
VFLAFFAPEFSKNPDFDENSIADYQLKCCAQKKYADVDFIIESINAEC